jgi:DNA processing protein
MSVATAAGQRRVACRECLRRSWLLGCLSPLLDYSSADVTRLLDLLALDDESLMDALGGSRRQALRSRYEDFDGGQTPPGAGVEPVCRHCASYPQALMQPGAPPMLHVLGSAARLSELAEVPTVAIAGTPRASDYGMEMARSLARGLTAAGITVVSALADGIAAAAQTGALERGGRAIAVSGVSLDGARALRRSPGAERLSRAGCVVSELSPGCDGRRWGALAAERIVVRLARLTVVVEADDTPRELAGAAIGGSLARPVAAIPGRVTSPVSRGTNALLLAGAELVRGAEDVLDLLHLPSRNAAPTAASPVPHLEPALADVLARVGAGEDTPGALADGAPDAGEALLALTELELMGLLTRGDGGRYVACGGTPRG